MENKTRLRADARRQKLLNNSEKRMRKLLSDPIEETQYDVTESSKLEENTYSYSEFGLNPPDVLKTKGTTLGNAVPALNANVTSLKGNERPTNLLSQVINSNILTLAMGCACRMFLPEAFVSFLLVAECLLLLNMMFFGEFAKSRSSISIIVSQVLQNTFTSRVSSKLRVLYHVFELSLQGFLMFSVAFILMHSVFVGND